MRTLLLAGLLLGGALAAAPGAAAADLSLCAWARVAQQPAEVCWFPDAVGPPLPPRCVGQARSLAGGVVTAAFAACVS